MPDIHVSEEYRNRLAVKIFEDSEYLPDTGCWVSNRHRNASGHAHIRVKSNQLESEGNRYKYKTQYLHRVSYTLFVGKIPEGKILLHQCDVPNCFCPDHLSVGEQEDNIIDMVKKKRNARGEKHSKAVLTKRDVLEIRDAAESGKTTRSIAEDFGTSESNIRKIVRRQTWRHF